MTTPAPAAATAQPAAADPLEAWFDATLRPVLLEHLAAADGGAANGERQAHLSTKAAVGNWARNVPGRAAAWSPETRDTVSVLMSELRGLIGD